MPIYDVTTPKGTRIVEAVSQKDAIEHVSQDDYHARTCSSIQLAHYIRQGLPIEVSEKVAKALKADDGQLDIEDLEPAALAAE